VPLIKGSAACQACSRDFGKTKKETAKAISFFENTRII